MRLSWDDTGSRMYDAGVDLGAFYPRTGAGVAWNGLTSITESVENAGSSVVYIDGERKANQIDLGTFSATVEAFTYPDEFIPYDGYAEPAFSGQNRPYFDLSYRTLIGNDVDNLEYGYRLHLVYNCTVTPTNRNNKTLNSNSDIQKFSWTLSTVPNAFPFNRPTAHLYLDSTMVRKSILNAIEAILYGTDGIDPRMPTIEEILALFEVNATFIVIDNHDGTATITGSNAQVFEDSVDLTLWTLVSPSVVPITDTLYQASTI